MPYIRKHDVQAEMNQKKNSCDTQLIAEASEQDYKIEVLIREQYSMSMETALHRKKLMGILSDEDWNKYVAFVQECIDKVKSEEETI